MTKNQIIRLISGAVLIAFGVLIGCSMMEGVFQYGVATASLILGVGLIGLGVAKKGSLMCGESLGGSVLLIIAILLFIPTDTFKGFAGIQSITVYVILSAFVGIGGILLVDSIIKFVKKRMLALNIIELIIAVTILTLGIVFMCIEKPEVVFILCGTFTGIFGLILFISGFINPEKYKAAVKEVGLKSKKSKK